MGEYRYQNYINVIYQIQAAEARGHLLFGVSQEQTNILRTVSGL